MLRILKDDRGFTLIELVIIIILIGVLAGVAIPRYVDMRTEAINAKAKALQDGMIAAISLDFANDMVNNNGVHTPPAVCGDDCNQPDDAGLTALHDIMEGQPSYPGPGTGTNGYDDAFGTGFWWYVVSKGDTTNPVQIYGLYNGKRVDSL